MLHVSLCLATTYTLCRFLGCSPRHAVWARLGACGHLCLGVCREYMCGCVACLLWNAARARGSEAVLCPWLVVWSLCV